MNVLITNVLALAIVTLALAVMMRPLVAFAAPAKPLLKAVASSLLRLLELVLGALLWVVRGLLEASRRA